MPPKIVVALQAKLTAARAAIRAAKAAALKAAAAKPGKGVVPKPKPKIGKAKPPRRRAGPAGVAGAKPGAVAPAGWPGVPGGGLGGVGGGAGGMLAAAVGWPPVGGVPPLGPPGALALPGLPAVAPAKPAAPGPAPKAPRRGKAAPVAGPPMGAMAPMPVVPGGTGALQPGGVGLGLPGGPPAFPPAPPLGGCPGGLAAPQATPVSLGAYGASASAPGHWLTCAVHGFHCLALGDTGRYIQVVLVDPATGTSLATTVVRVEHGHHSDGHGRFFEATWCGADQPTIDAAWAPMMGGAHQPVYHICTAPRTTCHLTWPGRNVLHLDTLRERHLAEIDETWFRLPPGAARPVAPAVPAVSPGPVVPGALPPGGVASPDAAKANQAAPAGAAAADEKVEKLKKKLKELQDKEKKRKNLDNLFGDKKEKKRKKKKDDSDDSSASFEDAPTRLSGSRIQYLARTQPGSLFRHGMEQVRRFLSWREGANADEVDVDGETASLMAYLQLIVKTSTAHGHLSNRSTKEPETLASAVDLLVARRLPELADLLMQRFKAIERNAMDGHWEIANQYEVRPHAAHGLATQDEVFEAGRVRVAADKLARVTGKVSGRGKGGGSG